MSSISARTKPHLRRSDDEQPEVIIPEVTSVICTVRKYVLRMRNRKLRHILPSGGFLTGSEKVTLPEEALSGSGLSRSCPDRKVGSAHAPFSPRFFLSSSNMATRCDWNLTTPVVVVSNDGWTPEEALSGSRFCACPAFSRGFFLVVTWLPKVSWPLRGSLGGAHAQQEVAQHP